MIIPKISSAQTNLNLSNLQGFDGEPYIAVNPANQNNIIAGWMRGRLDGKIWIATKASFDKGKTWSSIKFMPHDTSINGSADVAIAFHKSGTAYLSWINFRTSPDTVGAVYIAKSIDGGLTWGIPSKVIEGTEKPDLPFDRPWIAVDNSGGIHDGDIFVTTMSVYWYIGKHHIYLKTSSDGGNTWSSIKQVDNTSYSVGSLTASYGAISIGKDGRAYIAFVSYDVTASPVVRYYCVSTSNAGLSFQRNVIGRAYVRGADFTKGWCIKANPAINNNAILTWVDNRNGDYDILLSKTMDGGSNWSTPIRVNDDPKNNGVVQDMVWADFSPSGSLGISWRDRRLSGTSDTVPFDFYSAISLDTANTFKPNYRNTSVSNPYFAVPQGNSFIGCALSDSTLFVNWGDIRNKPDWDIYTSNTELSSITTSSNRYFKDPETSIELFPNPANGKINISFSIPPITKGDEIVIYNSLGKILWKDAISNYQSKKYTQEIDISDFPNGMYFLYLKSTDSYLKNKTFIKIEY